MRKYSTLFFLTLSFVVFCQEEDNNTTQKSTFKKFSENIYGSFESNTQWYLNDDKTGIFTEQERVRSNSYLKLDYTFLKNFTIGIQGESYLPEPLLNYSKLFDKKVGLAQYYANFRNKKIDITAGYFYEQFGSGLILRFWEDRALGVNNSLRGGRVIYNPKDFLEFTALYGRQRKGFTVAKSDILGFNTNFVVSSAFKLDKINDLSLGFSYVGKKEKYTGNTSDNELKFSVPEMVHAFSYRFNMSLDKLSTSAEYVYKSEDIRLKNGSTNEIAFAESKKFDANAILWTIGYSQKGLGLSYTFRRLEGMKFYSERNYGSGSINKTNQLTLNYLPGLTKQHDYTLANIYIYQAQPGLEVMGFDNPRVIAGEIGQQIDFFYLFKKGSLLGGKYGTKASVNYSYWATLNTKIKDPNGVPFFPSDNLTYKDDFLNFKNKTYTDINIEIRKKWSPKVSSIFSYVNLYYNKDVLESKADGSKVNAWIGIAESTYKLGKGKSARLELQHLSTKDDAKNWWGGTVEFFFNSKFGIYFNDSYNYEISKNIENTKIHFFNLGGSYTKGATRVSLNYGRQRGGLLCVGGVCRPVSKNTGVTLHVSTSF